MTDSFYHALVVDDEAAIRKFTAYALQQAGFRCDLAEDGVEASEKITRNTYDVVITDLRMPRRHGYALCQELLEQSKRPLIIVVTGVNDPRIATDLKSRGVDDVMFKPVDYKVLAARIRSLLEARQPVATREEDADVWAAILSHVAQENVVCEASIANSLDPSWLI